MADDELVAHLKVAGAGAFKSQMSGAARSVRGVGTAASTAGRGVMAMSRGVDRGLTRIGKAARFPALAVGGVGVAAVKMGLQFNAQLESSRLRFKLFTDDVDGLTRAVSKVDMSSAFDLASLSDATALMGNAGIKNLPKTLQATANAAAASGKGVASLDSISIALSQIAAKGKLSQEEINQLNEAGAPGAQRTIQKAFKLTTKEMGNLGAAGLDGKKAIEALTDAWTSGRMAKAAKAQTKTLGGQWSLLTGNMQKLSGAATKGLASDLSHNVLPAINDTATAMTEIFGRKGLSNTQKMDQAKAVIKRELGPVWRGIKGDIERADIPAKLGKAVEAGAPMMGVAMANAAPHAARAFVTAFKESGPWGKLLTAGFLVSKMSPAFSIVGGIMTRRMLKRAVFTMGADKTLTAAGSMAGGRAAGGFVDRFGSKAATGIRGLGTKSGLLNAFKIAGKGFGIAAAVTAGYELVSFINGLPTNRPNWDNLTADEQGQIELSDRTNSVGRGGTGQGGQYLYDKHNVDTTQAGSVITKPNQGPGGFKSAARLGARPPAMSGGGANLTVPVIVDGRELGRASARISLRDLVNA